MCTAWDKTIPERPGYLEIDEAMAEIVRLAFATFLREGSLSRAAIWLNDNGYRIKKQREGGGSFKRVGHFTVDYLQALLRNKVYIGVKVYTHRGETKEAKAVWPSIVDEGMFHRVGKILIEEELAAREFVPTITRIRSVSSFSTPSTWEVDTDRGAAQLVLKGEEDIRRLSGRTKLLIAASDGLHFHVPDSQALDRASRRLLERFS